MSRGKRSVQPEPVGDQARLGRRRWASSGSGKLCDRSRAPMYVLVALILIGGALRIAESFWGYPYQLHPDEPVLVNGAVDLVRRHSYESNTFSWPAHFVIKLNAVVFQIFSYLNYHVNTAASFDAHQIDFYIVSRLCTAFFGTLMIPLTYLTAGKISPRRMGKKVQLIAAGLVAFCPLLIKFTFATTDIYVAFFLLAISYLSLLYLETPSRGRLVAICVLTGIAITIKYNCAIVCLWIAAVICIDQGRKKKYLEIVKLGIFSALIVFLACFFAAPNLFTNLPATMGALKTAVRTEHLSADHLGWGGNLLYYLERFLRNIGYEGIVFLAAGCWMCVKKKDLSTVYFAMQMIFWILLSAAPLHWDRWGTPVYTFFVIILAVGIGSLIDRANRRWAKAVVLGLGGILILNTTLQGLLVVQSALTTSARVAALDFCEENGITAENTAFDGYSPFALNGGGTVNLSFDKDGNIVIPPAVEYIVLSWVNYDRYYAQPDKAPQVVRMYDAIQSKYQLIYDAGGQFWECEDLSGQIGLDKYRKAGLAVVEIPKAIQELMAHNKDSVGGFEVKIYQVAGEKAGLPAADQREKTDLPGYKGFRLKNNAALNEKGELVSDGTTGGTILYGPYSETIPGVYDITLNYVVESAADAGAEGTFDVALDTQRYAAIPFTANQTSVTLEDVSIEAGHQFEARVWIPEGMAIRVRSIHYTRVG